jgi:hypothetical protein
MHELRIEYWLGKMRLSSEPILDLLRSSSEQSGKPCASYGSTRIKDRQKSSHMTQAPTSQAQSCVQVPTEAHWSVSETERYHAPLRRAWDICCGYEEKQIMCWCSGATSSPILYLLPQMYHRYVMKTDPAAGLLGGPHEQNKTTDDTQYFVFHCILHCNNILHDELQDAMPDEAILRMAVKAVKDTPGPDGLVPTLLIFGACPSRRRHLQWSSAARLLKRRRRPCASSSQSAKLQTP